MLFLFLGHESIAIMARDRVDLFFAVHERGRCMLQEVEPKVLYPSLVSCAGPAYLLSSLPNSSLYLFVGIGSALRWLGSV